MENLIKMLIWESLIFGNTSVIYVNLQPPLGCHRPRCHQANIHPKWPPDRCIWMFPKTGGKPPKWMVKTMENPIKMDNLVVPLFLETPIWRSKVKIYGQKGESSCLGFLWKWSAAVWVCFGSGSGFFSFEKKTKKGHETRNKQFFAKREPLNFKWKIQKETMIRMIIMNSFF